MVDLKESDPKSYETIAAMIISILPCFHADWYIYPINGAYWPLTSRRDYADKSLDNVWVTKYS